MVYGASDAKAAAARITALVILRNEKDIAKKYPFFNKSTVFMMELAKQNLNIQTQADCFVLEKQAFLFYLTIGHHANDLNVGFLHADFCKVVDVFDRIFYAFHDNAIARKKLCAVALHLHTEKSRFNG